jgi:hypothetical protein
MLKLANRAKMSTATTGTGTITLGSAAAGFQSFADAGVVDGDAIRYVIEDGNNWEIGQGTYTASGTTLSRTVLESSNSDTAISLSGSATVLITAAAEDVAQVKIDTYTTAGSTTWTKPSWAKMVKVIAIGGGGGGGSGARYATSSARGGAAGGTGGSLVEAVFPASYLSATETVVVGAGGTGGASQTVDTSNGQPGSDGGNSSFGSFFIAGGGPLGGGGKTTITGGQAGTGFASFMSAVGGTGQTGTLTAGVSTTISGTAYAPATGGGGGGGAGASSTTGADGGYAFAIRAPSTTGPTTGILYATIDGGVKGTSGGAGGAGNSADFIDHKIATGGGGGSYATGQATGAGGNGAQPGGGGGGGAASDNGYASGAGGNGGDGWVRIISWA